MTEWMKIAIPKPEATRISRIFKVLGYKSISDFVADAVRRYLPEAENRFEEVNENFKSWQAEKESLSD